MESSKIIQDISSILNKFQPISKSTKNHSHFSSFSAFSSFLGENVTNDSEKLLTEIKGIQKQFDESYKELLKLKQEISPSSSIIKVLPNNSDDLL